MQGALYTGSLRHICKRHATSTHCLCNSKFFDHAFLTDWRIVFAEAASWANCSGHGQERLSERISVWTKAHGREWLLIPRELILACHLNWLEQPLSMSQYLMICIVAHN